MATIGEIIDSESVRFDHDLFAWRAGEIATSPAAELSEWHATMKRRYGDDGGSTGNLGEIGPFEPSGGEGEAKRVDVAQRANSVAQVGSEAIFAYS